jgi:hypothetical protein
MLLAGSDRYDAKALNRRSNVPAAQVHARGVELGGDRPFVGSTNMESTPSVVPARGKSLNFGQLSLAGKKLKDLLIRVESSAAFAEAQEWLTCIPRTCKRDRFFSESEELRLVERWVGTIDADGFAGS